MEQNVSMDIPNNRNSPEGIDCNVIANMGYNSLMDSSITTDSQILGGTPCFAGTRVPARSLFDYLEAGYTVDYFLAQFPTVTREHVLSLLECASKRTEEDAVAAGKR